MTDPKDQVAGQAAGEQSPEKPLSLDEQYDKGWEQVELLTSQENEAKAKAKPKEKAPEEAAAGEKKEPGDSTVKPFRVLKVGGKDVPVATEEELNALAMKGLDYTKKTQALADDRRGAEAELKAKAEGLEGQAARMNELLDRLVAAGIVPEKVAAAKKASAEAAGDVAATEDKVGEEDEAIFKEFQMDPANAYPHEKSIVRTLAELRREVQEIRLERAKVILDQAIAEERENFPFENVVDDQGVDLTKKQFGALMTQKRMAAGIEKPTVDQMAKWAKESVRELHDLQRKPSGGEISDDMDPEEFAKKHPKLANALKTGAAAAAVEEADAARAKLPPSIKVAPKPSDLTRRTKADPGKRKSLDEFLEEGFNDPETIKALNI